METNLEGSSLINDLVGRQGQRHLLRVALRLTGSGRDELQRLLLEVARSRPQA